MSTYNPFKLYKGAKEMGKRQSDKGIEGNLKGEGIVQGGIMVFNANGEVRKEAERKQKGSEMRHLLLTLSLATSPLVPQLTYVYKEMSGYEIPSDDIKAALDGIIG